MKRKFSISGILSKINRENLKKRFKEAAQMINLIYRNYSDGETQMLSTSLTYFSMLAIFPIVALILGITKGFGLDRLFIRKIFEIVPQNEGPISFINRPITRVFPKRSSPAFSITYEFVAIITIKNIGPINMMAM